MPSQTDYSNAYNRSPSVSSVGSRHGKDNTSTSDEELSKTDFERKCEDRIGLHNLTPAEEMAIHDPKLRRPEDSQELMFIHNRIVNNLRSRIAKLEEDEIFEQTLFRGSKVSKEEPVVSSDIDAIMRSMMGSSSTSIAHDPYKNAKKDTHIPSNPDFSYVSQQDTDVNMTERKVEDGPWNTKETRYEFGAGMDAVSMPQSGRKNRKGFGWRF